MTNSACNYNANTYDQTLNIYSVQPVIFVKSIYHETILFSYLWFSQNHIFRDKALWFWPLDILTLNKSVKALSLATFSRQRRVGLDDAGYLEEWPYCEFWPEHSTSAAGEKKNVRSSLYVPLCLMISSYCIHSVIRSRTRHPYPIGERAIVFDVLCSHCMDDVIRSRDHASRAPHRWTCHCLWSSLFPVRLY